MGFGAFSTVNAAHVPEAYTRKEAFSDSVSPVNT